jgi:hypothetical protein
MLKNNNGPLKKINHDISDFPFLEKINWNHGRQCLWKSFYFMFIFCCAVTVSIQDSSCKNGSVFYYYSRKRIKSTLAGE